MNLNKENINSLDTSTQDNIPFDFIKNPKPLNRAKTDPSILSIIVEEISKKLDIPKGVAKALIFGNLHTGGTASKSSPTHSFSLQYKDTEYFLDLSTLRTYAEKATSIKGQKFTLRQLARTHETEILFFASRINLPGNLNKKFLQIDPTLENEQLIYAADYVDPSNPTIPEQIKKLLTSHKNNTIT